RAELRLTASDTTVAWDGQSLKLEPLALRPNGMRFFRYDYQVALEGLEVSPWAGGQSEVEWIAQAVMKHEGEPRSRLFYGRKPIFPLKGQLRRKAAFVAVPEPRQEE